MWRRRLNSATLVNATHRELENGKVADETSTQVTVQMINRWRVKMIQKVLYKVGDSPQKGDGRGREKKQYNNPNYFDTLEQSSCTHSTSSDWRLIEINILALCLVATRSNTSRYPTL